MRLSIVAGVFGIVLLAGCLPTKWEPVKCSKTSPECSKGFVCDLTTNRCVCDGTATAPGCASYMDARPVGPEVMTLGDTIQANDGLLADLGTENDADGAQVDAAGDSSPDAAARDTATPDTRPVQCTTSTQCPGNAPICSSNTCAACTAASQCLAKDPNSPVCATTGTAAGQCVQCADDSSCKSLAQTPACGLNNRCVECTSKANCQGMAVRACDLAKNKCVECTDSTFCSGAAPICDVAANKCTTCTAASQCLAKDPNNPACANTGTAAGQCVQCVDDSSCKTLAQTPACNTAKNKCVECTTSGNCLPATPLCDTSINKCMTCTASNECALLADPKRAVCNSAGACVQCTKNTDCSGSTPLCDVPTNKCVPCTTSTQCAALSDAKRAICNSNNGACVECTDNTTCGGTTPICDTTTNKCTACKATNQCAALSDAKRAVCNLTSGACVECTASTSCAGTSPICNTTTNKCAACSTSTECAGLADANRIACASTGSCVQCTTSTHCSSVAGTTTPYCETGTNKCVECLTSTNCSGTKPICSSNLCGACKSDDECGARDSSKKACATSGSCVQCTSNAHCGGSTPICDTSTNTCRACTADSECVGIGPGVCMKHQDNRCASDAETVVVTSTPTLPSSIPSGKRLVIIRGSVTGTVTWTLPSTQVTIIGQATGVLTSNGTGATMHLTGGDFYMRDLSITGGSPGLWADGGAIARLDHLSVSNNSAGGILLDGAAFDIKNTTVNSNGANTGTLIFGGIGIQSTPSSGPKSLSYVTVNSNQQIGVSCGAGSSVSPVPTNVLATGNSGGQIGSACFFSPCTVASTTCGAQP